MGKFLFKICFGVLVALIGVSIIIEIFFAKRSSVSFLIGSIASLIILIHAMTKNHGGIATDMTNEDNLREGNYMERYKNKMSKRNVVCGIATATIAVVIACILVLTNEKPEERLESGRVTNESKTAPKRNRRRLAPQRSFVRHDDARRIVVGRESSNASDVPAEAVRQLSWKASEEMSVEDRAQMASDKNQVMDELLNLPSIPEDYGEQMIALFRDGEQDVFIRDFAVQHIGLYAQALRRRGKYNPESPESASLRRALDDAASETRTIVAAAAFRALSDMAVFDPNIDRHRLDSRLVACISDSGASVAARVVAVQLCGERRIGSARSALAALAADAATPETLRRSAIYASAFIGGK